MGGKPPKRHVELPWTPEELHQRQIDAALRDLEENRRAGRDAALQTHRDRQRRGSSMRTLFELRGRTWVVRPLLGLALAGAAYALTRLFLH